ncbi:hypothetical protein [Streptomyces kanamyceticus]|uniref:Uncharacterized protein n=1 Tax=Streptomyces kanamyceticus TaxID=1967 RepID=A0A5J6GLM6_STRKN|nr:hypothetical protein [Streptomyces kanamyceticus]QEU96820.1 hypothetical protein CP970_43035 [Streptomyces kanamyceticus]
MTDVSDASVDRLAAPTIDEAVDSAVVLDDGIPQLVIRVEPYAGMSGGDQVYLRWDTGVLRTSRVETHVVDATEVGHSTLFTIPTPRPGAARVSYVISRATGEWRASDRLDITVRGRGSWHGPR